MNRFYFISVAVFLFFGCAFAMRTHETTLRFVKNPSLGTVWAGYPGNRMIDGIFVNGETKDRPPLWSVITWKLSKNPQGDIKRKDTYKPGFVKNENLAESPDDRIVWLGHASFYIKINGVSMITDPCFGDLPMVERRIPLPCSPESLGNIDYILISHGHRDHCDKESLRLLVKTNPRCLILGPLGLEDLIKNLVKDLGPARVQEAGWYQVFDTHDPQIVFLPAVHWNRRGLFDFNRMLWGGFLIRSGGRSVFFAGDTAYSGHFEEIRKVIGPVSVCLVPIGSYKPEYLMKSEHTNPEEAVRAAVDLDAGILIPMHYGTYDLSNEPMGEPVELLKKASGLFNRHVEIPAVGEVFRL